MPRKLGSIRGRIRRTGGLGAIFVATLLAGVGGACDGTMTPPGMLPPVNPNPTTSELENRAYIVSRDSDDLTVIDLGTLQVIGRLGTGGVADHMGELNADFTKLYVDSEFTDESVVVDLRALKVAGRIKVGKHPTHLTLLASGLMAIMNEEEGAVSFVDTTLDTEVKRVPGFYTPHFLRTAPGNDKIGYVANVGAYHITRMDLDKLEIIDHVALEGFSGPPNITEAPYDKGFADVQIDRDGMLYAAHGQAGRVLVYDTKAGKKMPELVVGHGPWIVYAQHPFANVPLRHLVPNFGDQTVSMIDGAAAVVKGTMPGDEEAFGVNYTSAAPDQAFVMNRMREQISLVDLTAGVIKRRIDVGGKTETASTTADGKWIVAAVSSTNRVVVLDAVTGAIVKAFENVGKYPWSVTIPNGQNYCH
jgi:YVTN family beta-propeller protein